MNVTSRCTSNYNFYFLVLYTIDAVENAEIFLAKMVNSNIRVNTYIIVLTVSFQQVEKFSTEYSTLIVDLASKVIISYYLHKYMYTSYWIEER
jgi:hypothetical protein